MPTGSAQIRPAVPKDAPLLTEIAKRAKAHWGYPPELLTRWEDDLTVSPESCDGDSIWVIENETAIIGFGEILMEGQTAFLDDLWIDPTFIGSGFGRQLFRHMRDGARDRGATRLTLEADPHAVGFYERMGARVTGAVQSDSIPGRSLPLMELDLTTLENTTINLE